MRILVTGGTGFLGAPLVRRLLSEEHHVAVTTRAASVLRHERLRDVGSAIEVVEVDVRNSSDCERIARWAPEVVWHLAGYTHVGQEHDRVEECYAVNTVGTALVLDAALRSGTLQRFVYVGTSETYGYQEQVPWTEDMPARPISPYGISKFAGELHCRIQEHVEGRAGIIACLRPFNTYGPGQSTRAVIPDAIVKCLRGLPVRATPGQQTRDYLYIDDAVEGIYRAGFTRPFTDVVNLATGVETRIADLLGIIRDLCGSSSEIQLGRLPYRPTEMWRMVGDARRAAEVLGWRPTVELADGLRRTIEWFRGRPEVIA